MEVISQAAGGRPKKRSRRQQPNQPAESLDSLCQNKPPQDSSTVLAATTTNVGVGDAQTKFDSGTLRKDTTGTFRIAFHYTYDVRQKTVEWIMANCGNAYTRPVTSMWQSGDQAWTKGLPVPPSTSLANWLREHRKRQAATVEKPILTKQQLSEGRLLAHTVRQEQLGASIAQLTSFQIQMNVP